MAGLPEKSLTLNSPNASPPPDRALSPALFGDSDSDWFDQLGDDTLDQPAKIRLQWTVEKEEQLYQLRKEHQAMCWKEFLPTYYPGCSSVSVRKKFYDTRRQKEGNQPYDQRTCLRRKRKRSKNTVSFGSVAGAQEEPESRNYSSPAGAPTSEEAADTQNGEAIRNTDSGIRLDRITNDDWTYILHQAKRCKAETERAEQLGRTLQDARTHLDESKAEYQELMALYEKQRNQVHSASQEPDKSRTALRTRFLEAKTLYDKLKVLSKKYVAPVNWESDEMQEVVRATDHTFQEIRHIMQFSALDSTVQASPISQSSEAKSQCQGISLQAVDSANPQ